MDSKGSCSLSKTPMARFLEVVDQAYQQGLCPHTRSDGTPARGPATPIKNWGVVMEARDAAAASVVGINRPDLESKILELYESVRTLLLLGPDAGVPPLVVPSKAPPELLESMRREHATQRRQVERERDEAEARFHRALYALTPYRLYVPTAQTPRDEAPPDAPVLTPATATDANKPPARPSPDFRSVHWYGTVYAFTATQAAIVTLLWKAWENGTPDVGADTLLETVDAETSRLVDIFRDHPAWGTMIVDGQTKGSKRLAGPPKS
jgi:hypothetical protein